MLPSVIAAPVPNDGVWSRERRALTLGILLAVAAFATEGMGVVPALPTAVRALGGLPLFGWLFSAFMLAWLVGTIAAGQIADMHGPRRPMALGLFGFGAGLLLAAGAGGMPQFLAGRVLQGLGGGATIAAAYVAIARAYPDRLRAHMMAIASSVWVVPAIVGPALSGMVAERTSWRLVFAGVVPLLVIVAGLLLPALGPLVLREPRPTQSRIPAALQLALGAGLVLAVPNLGAAGWWAQGGLAGLGLVLLLPALRTLLPTGTLLARRGLPAGLLLRGLLAFSFFGTEAFVPLSTGELRGVTPTQAGLALSTGSLGWIAASWMQVRADKHFGSAGRIRSIRIGFCLVALGIAIVTVALLTSLPFALIPAGWALGGAGIGAAYSAGGLLCIGLAPAGREGEVSAQLQLTEALGTAIGTGVAGAMIALFGRFATNANKMCVIFFGLAIAVAFLGAALAPRQWGAGEPADSGIDPATS